MSAFLFGNLHLFSLVLTLVLSVVSSSLARTKGYNRYIWFAAGGIVGLFVVACLPYANEKELPQELNDRRQDRGDYLGLGLIIVELALFAAMRARWFYL